MNDILNIKNLSKKYQDFSLKDVSFALPKGYIMGFIGPNGAGKTTTIKSILGMVSFDNGSIEILGMDCKIDSEKIKDDVGVVMDLPFYVDEWKLKQVEKAVCGFYSAWNHEKYLKLLDKFQISPNKKVKDLSRGMKVKLMISVALSHDAKLLILDEPTSGLDPVARDDLMDILREFVCDDEHGVIFSTHITSDLEKVADYITFIRKGEIAFSGEKDLLLEKYLIIKGGPNDVSVDEQSRIIGFRLHSTGFDGIIETSDRILFSDELLFEKPTLDDIIVYMERRGYENV